MASDPKQSILAKAGEKSKHRVDFGTTPGDNKPKPAAKPTAAVQVTAPPPAAGFKIKDEVEMLRCGFKNAHGEQVKSQGSNEGGANCGPPSGQTGSGQGRATEIELN